MKEIASSVAALCVVIFLGPLAPSLGSEPSASASGGGQAESIEGSIRLNGDSYELAHNYAPGSFSYRPIGGDPSLLSRALDLNRQIDEELSSNPHLLGLYAPLSMEVIENPDGSIVLVSFSRAPGYYFYPVE